MPYLLAPLLKVRQRRERAAAADLARKNQAVLRCRRDLADCEKKLKDYHEWRIAEEDRRWARFMGSRLPLKKVEDFLASLSELRQAELVHESKVAEAKARLEDAEQAAEQARHAHHAAVRSLEKLREHHQQWEREQRLEAERAADRELEDFRQFILDASLNDNLALSP